MPNVTPLPQISHFAISCTSLPLGNQFEALQSADKYISRYGWKLQALFSEKFEKFKKSDRGISLLRNAGKAGIIILLFRMR